MRSGCPYCGLLKLQAALSKIDYACGKPNDMEVSDYDVYYDEDAVVENVKRALAARSAIGEREGFYEKLWKDFCSLQRGDMIGVLERVERYYREQDAKNGAVDSRNDK